MHQVVPDAAIYRAVCVHVGTPDSSFLESAVAQCNLWRPFLDRHKVNIYTIMYFYRLNIISEGAIKYRRN